MVQNSVNSVYEYFHIHVQAHDPLTRIWTLVLYSNPPVLAGGCLVLYEIQTPTGFS